MEQYPRWFEIFSLVLFPWALVARLFGVVSPFPLCLAATAFAIPYHAFVLQDKPRQTVLSTSSHVLLTLVAPIDVTNATLAMNIFVFLVHASVFDFIHVYSIDIPRFHREVRAVDDRFGLLFR